MAWITFNRFALPLALLGMGGLVLALPILRVHRMTGVWLVVPHRSPRPVDRLMGYGGVVPSLWTVCGLLAVGFFFAIQTRLEEEHLLRLHGESFRAYGARTGRFVPGIGCLP